MAGLSVLKVVNGVPRLTAVVQAYTTPYQQSSLVVASGATGTQINGPITSGTAITLPGSQTYTSNELVVTLNGEVQYPTTDVTYMNSTQISLSRDVVVGDILGFLITRSF